MWCNQWLLHVVAVFGWFLFFSLFFFLFLLFAYFFTFSSFYFSFFRDCNMVSISIVEFRYYVIIILLVDFRRQLRLINFQWISESEGGQWVLDSDFPCKCFCVLFVALSEVLLKDILECTVNPLYLKGCCDCSHVILANVNFRLH